MSVQFARNFVTFQLVKVISEFHPHLRISVASVKILIKTEIEIKLIFL